MENRHVLQSRNHMATTFEFTISCEAGRSRLAQRTLARAHEEIDRIERELSEFLPDSPIYRLNHSDPGSEVELTEDGIRLLELCSQIGARTHGTFDCTAKSRCPLPSGSRLVWNSKTFTASRAHEGVRVGFGAIGKGFALDRARTLIEREGFNDYILSGGGSSIVLSGFAAPYRPWTWSWSGVPFVHLTGKPIALGISGLQHQGEHILDPRSGSAARGPQSALVAHPSAAAADALSTSLFVAGWDQGFDDLEDPSAEPAAAMIDSEGVPRWNGIFDWLWGAPAALALLLSPSTVLAQEEVDLSDFGLNDFNPYVFERQEAWIILPLLMIALVILHFIRPKKIFKKIRAQTQEAALSVKPRGENK